MKKLISVVLPIYKNEQNLPVTIPYILEKIPVVFPNYDVELILVNDGSPDNSWEIMKEFQVKYPEVIKIVKLTRNFGQRAASTCGMTYSSGDAVGIISADLQDPFELFSEMVEKWEQGFMYVGGQRESRDERGIGVLFSNLTHFLTRKLINKDFPTGGCDFHLVDKKLVHEFCAMGEQDTSLAISFLWLGYKTTFIPYRRKKRELGTSAYTLSKKIRALIDRIITNSYFPLRLMSTFGCLSAGTSFLYGCYIFIKAMFFRTESSAQGWTSIVLFIIFFGGLTLLSLGIIGEYMWRILERIRSKPIYVVETECGFEKQKGVEETP